MIVHLLLRFAKPIWVKDISEEGKTLIHAACLGNQIAVLDFLLQLDKKKTKLYSDQNSSRQRRDKSPLRKRERQYNHC